ncbi:MAG: hypothetical protein V2B18_16895 [Pseudomonadota bacterium]|jgi:hypothetical protein
MVEFLVILFDFVSAVGIIAVAYIIYRKFVGPPAKPDSGHATAYEEGFSDAVKYFGLKKLYEEDPVLRERMQEVFGEAGITHRIKELLDRPPENKR